MISWIQTILQKHNKWLFSILLVVIIVAFVFTIGATPNMGNVGSDMRERNFFGFNIASQQVQQSLSSGVELSFYMNNRRPQQAEFENAVKQRAIMLYLADGLEIPGPTEQQLAAFIRERPAFIDPATGNFSANTYTKFIDTIEQTQRYTKEDIARVLAQDYRINQVGEAVSGPGYVLPYLAARQDAEYKTTWSVEVATIQYDDFSVNITPTDEDLQAFFEQAGARYQTAAMQTVQYVYFDAANYFNSVAVPSDEELQAYYTRNLSKWPKDDEGVTKPLDAIRDEVVAALQAPKASNDAANAAQQLILSIHNAIANKTLPAGDEAAIIAFVKAKGLTVQESPAFSVQGAAPAGFPLPQNFKTAVDDLTDRRLYSDVLESPKGAYVLFHGVQIAPTMPEMEQIRARVANDYQATQKNRAFTENGDKMHKAIEAALATGMTFKAEAEKLGLAVKTFDNFTIMAPPEDLPQYYFYQLTEMKEGEVSPLLRYGPEGVFLYVKQKTVPDVSTDDAELKEAMTNLGYYYSSATAQGILRDLVVIGNEQAAPKGEL